MATVCGAIVARRSVGTSVRRPMSPLVPEDAMWSAAVTLAPRSCVTCPTTLGQGTCQFTLPVSPRNAHRVIAGRDGMGSAGMTVVTPPSRGLR
jgi:hypothetical protein